MAISTYAELKAAVENWAKRSDIGSIVDDFIDLAEADMWQRLRIRDMETRATGTLSGRTLALPADYQEIRKLRLTTDPSTELTFRVPEALTVETGSGKPSEYTITDQIEFERTPDSSYGYELTYFKSLTALSSSNTTNAALTRFPMVYLYGCLFYFGQWALNDNYVTKYGALFDGAIKAANKADRRGRVGKAPAMKSERSTP